MRKRQWRLQRQFMAPPQAQRRWDQAFQCLLSLNKLPLPLPPIAQKLELEEVAHASSSLCTCLDSTSGADPNN